MRDRFPYFILNGHEVIPALSMEEWAIWFSKAERHVRLTRVGPYVVSTVFLSLDHNFGEGGAPLLFETMVYCELPDGAFPCTFLDHQERCSTWAEAELQHQAMIDQVREPGAADLIEEIASGSRKANPPCCEALLPNAPWREKVSSLIDGEITFDVDWHPGED